MQMWKTQRQNWMQKMKKFTDDAIKFEMDHDTGGLYDFDEKDEKGKGKR